MMQPVPLRPDEEVAGGFIVLSVGGQTKHLPELKRYRNREWKALVQRRFAETLGATREVETFDDVVNLIAGGSDLYVELLVAYDDSGVLGGAEWLDRNATDRDLYFAFKKVASVAFPETPDLLTRIPGLVGVVVESLIRSSRSTNGSRRSTAGRRKRSSAA